MLSTLCVILKAVDVDTKFNLKHFLYQIHELYTTVRIWGRNNLHKMREMGRDSWKLNIWCGVILWSYSWTILFRRKYTHVEYLLSIRRYAHWVCYMITYTITFFVINREAYYLGIYFKTYTCFWAVITPLVRISGCSANILSNVFQCCLYLD